MNSAETTPQCRKPSGGQHFRPPHLLVGRNRRGQWVVRDQQARCGGGLFNSLAEALWFAFRERGEVAGAVVLVPDVLEFFDMPANGIGTPVTAPNLGGGARERILEEI
jgi:hypothetical protein